MAFSAGRGKNAATAVTAINIAGQKSFSDILPRDSVGRSGDEDFCAIFKCDRFLIFGGYLLSVISGALFPGFLYPRILFRTDNLKLRENL